MEKAEAEMNRVQKPVEEIEELCPECGRQLVIRTGRFGRFISCSGFPECRYRRSFMNKTGALCPQCGGDLVERKTKQKKRVFYGCSNYPICNFAIWERPVPDLCPNCGGLMVIPRGGQDPVCYTEVASVQQASEEKPQQNGTTSSRGTRKRTASPGTAHSALATSEAKTNGRASTTVRKRTATATGKAGTAKSAKTGASATKKTTTRASARKTTTTARGKSTSSRAKPAKAK